MRFLPILILVAGCGGDASKDGTDDLKSMQGSWKVEAGRLLDRNKAVIIKANAIGDDFSFALNASKAPKQIDCTFTSEGVQKGTVLLGIYELKGDTLKICLGLLYGKRPEKMETQSNDYEYLVLTRN